MNNVRVSCIITDNNITVNYNGETHIVSRQGDLKSVALADALIQALKQKKYDNIPNLVSAAKRVETYGQGAFKVDGGRVYVGGRPCPDQLSRKILSFQEQKLPHEPMVKFAENLVQNPSYRAVNELFQFLEKNNHPITEDGNFIAYRKVRSDFKDAHTGTMDNSVGQVVEMPRNQVNEDPTQTCSNGLHAANWDYAHNHYSAGSDPVMLEVEINPRDVVAVPIDYDQAKMRVCRFKVLGVVTQPHEDGVQLRTTTSEVVSDLDEGTCSECGETCSVTDETCDDCQGKAEEEEVCSECGSLSDVDPCDICYEEQLAEEEEELEEEELEEKEKDDPYPYYDEIEEEED